MRNYFLKPLHLILLLFLTVGCMDEDKEKGFAPIKNQKIKSQVLLNEDGTEISRSEYTYDSEGREIGLSYYDKGLLFYKFMNYAYDGLQCTCFLQYYDADGAPYDSPSKKTLLYLDTNYVTLRQLVKYDIYGMESTRMEYDYDTEGREVEYRYFFQGTIRSRQINYVYNGLDCEYDIDTYEGNIIRTYHKMKVTYIEKDDIRTKVIITSWANGPEVSRTEYDYDREGREVGMRTYSENKLIAENSNYKYDGKKCTYDLFEISGYNGKESYSKLVQEFY